jgi:N-acyl-D-aspartate/D-glutamate deacylase
MKPAKATLLRNAGPALCMDGTGTEIPQADIAVQDGVITAVGQPALQSTPPAVW